MIVSFVTHDSVFSRYLASRLWDAGVVDRIVVETNRPSTDYYWRKLRRVGLTNALFQLHLNRHFRRVGERLLPAVLMPPHAIVDNINRREFEADELVLGFGTNYVSARTLARTPLGVLNIHTGLLPEYRGVKSEFWALYLRGVADVGWTLHFMTRELDAGDIVLRRPVTVGDREDPAAVRARLVIDAGETLPELLRTARRDGASALPRTPQPAGRYFTTPTWRDWQSYVRGRRPAGLTARSDESGQE